MIEIICQIGLTTQQYGIEREFGQYMCKEKATDTDTDEICLVDDLAEIQLCFPKSLRLVEPRRLSEGVRAHPAVVAFSSGLNWGATEREMGTKAFCAVKRGEADPAGLCLRYRQSEPQGESGTVSPGDSGQENSSLQEKGGENSRPLNIWATGR